MNYPSYDKSMIAIRYWLLAKEYYTALEAMEFALQHHTGMRKDNTTPEFYHQLSVVYYIRTIYKNLLYPQETIATAFLHDLAEDYSVSISHISGRFGENIAASVRILTKINEGLEKPSSLYFEEISNNCITSIIKAADRIHNVQSMIGVFNRKKQEEYIFETEEYVIPMIKRARRAFPQQEPAYENAKHFLRCQVELIKAIHGAENGTK